MQPFSPAISMNELIPHRPPMQLLDRVIASSKERLLGTAHITRSAPFCTSDGVPSCMGLEYLGQCAAAFFSVQRTGSEGMSLDSPAPGMLIASRSYLCRLGHFPLDEHLLFDVSPTSQVGSSGLVKFRGAIYVVPSAEETVRELSATSIDDLNSVLAFAQRTEPFAEGDLSVYLPPADSSAGTT